MPAQTIFFDDGGRGVHLGMGVVAGMGDGGRDNTGRRQSGVKRDQRPPAGEIHLTLPHATDLTGGLLHMNDATGTVHALDVQGDLVNSGLGGGGGHFIEPFGKTL